MPTLRDAAEALLAAYDRGLPMTAIDAANALRTALASAQDGGQEADARRYRWLRDQCDGLSYTQDTGPRPSTPDERIAYALANYDKKTLDMIEIRLMLHHLGPREEPFWTANEEFDYARNMDAAIDAMLSAAPKGEGS